MPKKTEKKEEKTILDTMPKLKMSVFFQSIIYTLSIIAIFGAFGYYLDLKNDSAPKITIISILISYPITRIVLLKKVRGFATKKLTKKN